jgi:hypothetical protein
MVIAGDGAKYRAELVWRRQPWPSTDAMTSETKRRAKSTAKRGGKPKAPDNDELISKAIMVAQGVSRIRATA